MYSFVYAIPAGSHASETKLDSQPSVQRSGGGCPGVAAPGSRLQTRRLKREKQVTHTHLLSKLKKSSTCPYTYICTGTV